MAVWAKIVAVFGKIFWGGFWRVWAPKVAVSDFDLLETLLSKLMKNYQFFLEKVDVRKTFFLLTSLVCEVGGPA